MESPSRKIDPFLSEFEGTLIEKFLLLRSRAFLSIFALLAGLGVVLVLGHLGYSNALLLKIPFEYRLPGDEGKAPPETLTAELVFGYLAQLNHGFLYLFVAPIGICLAWRFIGSTTQAFRLLSDSPRLETTTGVDPFVAVARWNRNVFCCGTKRWPIIAILVFMLMVGQNLWREADYFKPEIRNGSNKIGFTQTIDLPNVISRYNSDNLSASSSALSKEEKDTIVLKTQISRLKVISSKQEITKQMRASIHGRVLAELGEAKNAELNRIAFEKGGIVKSSPSISVAEAAHMGAFGVDLKKAIESGALVLIGKAEGKGVPETKWQRIWFYCFAFVAHLYEGAFHALCIYLLLKIVFFLWVMHRAFGGGDLFSQAASPLTIKPNFRDKGLQYGLGEFYPVYNTISWMVLIAAAACLFMYISNASNGTFVALSGGTTDIADQGFKKALGQILIMLLPAILLSFLIIGPMVFFKRHLHAATEEALAECNGKLKTLEKDLDNANDTKELLDQIEAIEDHKVLIRSQYAWPRHSASFTKCLWISGLLLLLPLGLAPLIAGLGIDSHTQVVSWGPLVEKEVHRITRIIYGSRFQ